MRNLHVFRPTAFDALEDRVVMATSAGAISGLALSDVFLVQNEVDGAFSRFSNDLFNGFDTATSFPSSPTTTNALVGPTLTYIQSQANERVSLLAQDLSDVLSPLRRSGRSLVPAMLAIVGGPGNGSLANTVSATFSRLNTAVNATQGPNITPAQQAGIQQANQDIQTLQRQLFAQIDSARVAVNNQLRLFSATPQGRAGRQARLDLTSAQNAISPAYNTFQNGLTAAIAAGPTTPTTSTSFQNDINNLRLQLLNLTNTLNSQLSSVIGSSLGSSGSSNRVRTYVRNEINGLNSASLLNDINQQLDPLSSQGLPTPPGTLSLSAINFGISNIIAQSRLETAGLLAVGSA